MKVHWSDHEGFTAVQERMLMIRMILNDAGDKKVDGEYRKYKTSTRNIH